MAKPELRHNPKFKRLCRKLWERAHLKLAGLPPTTNSFPAPFVVGLLECMWHAGQESKNSLLGDETDVELAAEWPGKPGILFEVLKDECWIDQIEGKWHIHDFEEHATDYVKRELRKRKDKELRQNSPDESRKNPESVRGDARPSYLPTNLPTNQPRTTARAGDGSPSADEGNHADAGALVDGDALDHEIRAYYREHPRLNWDAKAHGSTRQLVEKFGWERARALIDKGVGKGKRFPATWALSASDGDGDPSVGSADAPAVPRERLREIAQRAAAKVRRK